jgi:predicted SAM-dependent methyltransferase
MSYRFPKRLNIGCGYDKRAGFLNVDMEPSCEPDVLVCDNDFSELPRRYFEYVLACDVLEHIPRSETVSALLAWADLMPIGATLDLKTSDIIALADLMRKRSSYADQHGLTCCMFGNQMHPGDFHFTGFTETTLRVLLASAGFECGDFTLVEEWMIHTMAVKTEDWRALAEGSTSLSDFEFVRQAYLTVFFREPEEPYHSMEVETLQSGMSREQMARRLYAADERRYRVADKLGL